MWRLGGLPRWAKWGLEPLMFNFKEVPLWNVADMAKSSKDPSMMDVDLGNMICMASSSTWTQNPLSLSSGGTVEQLPLVSLATTSQHRKPPSATLGVLSSTSVGDPLNLKWMDPATLDAMATSPWASPGDAMLEHALNTILVSQSPSHMQHQKFQTWPTSPPVPSLNFLPGLVQLACLMKYFDCKGQWTKPWSSCSGPGPSWTLTGENWCKMLTLPGVKMRTRLLSPSKR